MAELNAPIYDFRHGVLTPKLKDRPNLDLYKSGVLVGENFLTTLHGPTFYRGGFIHSRTTRRNNVAHFIPFTFADDEAYVLSFTEGYMRIFTDGGVLTEDELSITGITQANPGVVTVVGNDYADGDEIFIDECTGMTDLNGQFFLVANSVGGGTSEINYPFSVPANYSYNATDVEVTAGVAQLKDQPIVPYAWYHMNESSGTTVADSSGNGRNATTVNLVDADWVPAKINNGLQFNAVNDEYVDCGAIASFDFDDPFSLEIWVQADLSGRTRYLFGKGDGANGIGLYIEADGDLRAELNVNGAARAIIRTVDVNLEDNLWHHVIMTYDGSRSVSGLILYVDNVVPTTLNTTDSVIGGDTMVVAQNMCIGASNGGALSTFRDGILDEAVIYDQVLSLTEIAERWNSGLGTETMPSDHVTTNPTIEPVTGFPFTDTLEDFTETATKPANTELKYIVTIDDGSNWLYWSGAAWVASNETYAQSNTAAEIDTNIGTLGTNGTFNFRAFLNTTDTDVSPELDNIHTQFTVVGDTFTLQDQDGNDIDTTNFDAYIGSGTAARVYEIFSPYQEEHLPQLKFAQKADIMYIDHPLYAPRKIVRYGDGTWTLLPYERTNDPFGQVNITNITSANPAQVTTDTDHNFVDDDIVLIENVSGMTEVNHNTYLITKVNDTNFTLGVDSTAYGAYTSGGVTLLDGDPPATVGFYGGRVFHGGSLNDPDILFGSRSPDPASGATRYEDFTVGSNPDDGVSYALTSASTSSVDRIRFFMGTRQFLATGTYAGMLKVNGGSDATPISGTAIESFPVDAFGVDDQMPVNFGTDIIYAQRGGEVVYSFKYTLLSDGWQSEDETLQSDEITLGGIKQMAYQQGNPNQIWCAMNDGRLLSFVYSDGEDVSAWNEHLLGGDGVCLTVAAQPQDDNKDRVWIAVERTIDGVTRRYVEYLAKNPRIPERTDYYSGSDSTAKDADDLLYRNDMFYAQKRQVHLDSSLSLDTTQTATITPGAVSGASVLFTAGESIFSAEDVGRKIQVKYLTGTEQGIAKIVTYVNETAVRCEITQDFASTDTLTSGEWYFSQDTISGLDHLEGETVSIVGDGGIHPDRVVTNGTITLAGQVTYAIVGLFYFGRIRTMPLELLLSTGITPGKFKSVNKINLMFRNTLGVSYGTNPYDMQRIGFRDGVQYTDRPTLLFNGVKEQPGFDNYDEQRTMWVIQTVPYPCTLNSMVCDMEFSEEN